MCVMGLQPEQEQAVEAWVDELHGESEDSSDVSTIASVDGDPSSLLDMMSAVKVLLDGLGEDVTRDGLLKTPLRVAQAFQGATKGLRCCFSFFSLSPSSFLLSSLGFIPMLFICASTSGPCGSFFQEFGPVW